MQRGNLDDLLAFVAVGRERSFTKARGEARRFAVGAQPHHSRTRGAPHSRGSAAPNKEVRFLLEHDPEKWIPVFGKDHAPRIT